MEVAATFGSIGDIIAICGLIKALVDILSSGKGSSAKFRSLIQHLNHLETALRDFEDLRKACESFPKYESLGRRVQLEVLSCKPPIEEFRAGLEKYRKALRPGGSGNRLKDGYWKVKFAVEHADEVETFRQFVRDRVQIMVAIIGTAKMKAEVLAEEVLNKQVAQAVNTVVPYRDQSWNDNEYEALKERVERLEGIAAQGVSPSIIAACQLGGAALKKVQLIGTIAIQTFRNALYLQALIPQTLALWSQQPACLDDALCRLSPIPLETIDSWHVFDALLQARFNSSMGLRRIQEKQYILQDAVTRDVIRYSDDFKAAFRPGRSIVMFAHFTNIDLSKCPGCQKENQGQEDEIIHCKCGKRYRWTPGIAGDNQQSASASAMTIAEEYPDSPGTFVRSGLVAHAVRGQ